MLPLWSQLTRDWLLQMKPLSVRGPLCQSAMLMVVLICSSADGSAVRQTWSFLVLNKLDVVLKKLENIVLNKLDVVLKKLENIVLSKLDKVLKKLGFIF